ncbi:hypothetical protein [Sinorhizobium fredii]|uniref:hypothetical protein n=1 Tax=Rhizobium fredii TaxID=380 RepID=UPI0030B03413
MEQVVGLDVLPNTPSTVMGNDQERVLPALQLTPHKGHANRSWQSLPTVLAALASNVSIFFVNGGTHGDDEHLSP